MAQPFIGQVEIFAFDFPPKGWTLCNGALLPVNQYGALFALLGTTYGGDGRVNFALPDLRGRIPVGWGQSFNLGQSGGEETHTLSTDEMGSHNHPLNADTSAPATNNTSVPSTSVVLGRTAGKQSGAANPFALNLYTSGAPAGSLDSHSIGFTGGGQAHPNMMPYLTLNFCICVVGNTASPD